MPHSLKLAPDFSLADTEGRLVRLSDYRGKKNVVLVFNRGFVWPFCRAHLAQLRQDYHEFRQRDAEILCIGPDGPRSFRRYWEKEKIPFVGLSDHTHRVADHYNQEVSLLKLGRMPALFVIDKAGHIRYSHHGSSMADIPEQAELLAILDRLDEQVLQPA